jgi:hypothetical protein
MKKIFNYVAISLILLLGLTHTSLTPLFYKTFDLSALWFAGTGLSFIFLGLINISRVRSSDKNLRILCLIANIVALIFCILIVLVISQPQVYLSLFGIALLMILSIIELLPVESEINSME